jgi:hypothetical protein
MVLLGTDYGLIRWLAALVRMPPRHDATMTELALAALCVLAGCAGAASLALGGHLFDRIDVPRRRYSPFPDDAELARFIANAAAPAPTSPDPSPARPPRRW